MKLSVIIPSRTASNLGPCMAAVRKHEHTARILIIDDGVDWAQMPRTWNAGDAVIPGVKPFVYARNVNKGIRRGIDDGVEAFVLLNDDALLRTPGGFSLIHRAACANAEFGIISASCNLVGNINQWKHTGAELREEPRMVCFVAVLIPRRTVEIVGMLDERFTAYGWEDNDYCRRVRNAGLKIGIHDGAFCDHGSLRSTFRGHPLASKDTRPGAEIYKAKWGDLN